MDKEFAISIAQSRAICVEPGRYYQVKVTADPHFYDPDGESGRFIVNFAAMTGEQAGELQQFFTDNPSPDSEDLTTALNSSQLSYSIWVNSDTGVVPWKPSKGELVKIALGYVENQEGDQVLRAISCAPLQVESAQKFSLKAVKETADSGLTE